MTLDALMIKFAAGDDSAFETIYLSTQKTVYYIALSIVRERSLAEDVMQSCYLSVIRRKQDYRKGTNAAAWIAKIARNEAIDVYRKRQREHSVDEQEFLSSFGTTETDDYGLLIDLAKNILPQDEFMILMLVSAEGYKRREIAKMLEMPLNTVTWKYQKALKTMRGALEEKNGKEEGR